MTQAPKCEWCYFSFNITSNIKSLASML